MLKVSFPGLSQPITMSLNVSAATGSVAPTGVIVSLPISSATNTCTTVSSVSFTFYSFSTYFFILAEFIFIYLHLNSVNSWTHFKNNKINISEKAIVFRIFNCNSWKNQLVSLQLYTKILQYCFRKIILFFKN